MPHVTWESKAANPSISAACWALKMVAVFVPPDFPITAAHADLGHAVLALLPLVRQFTKSSTFLKGMVENDLLPTMEHMRSALQSAPEVSLPAVAEAAENPFNAILPKAKEFVEMVRAFSEKAGRSGRRALARSRAESQSPVSYTHLTLPTICSV
eukprot:491641-Alexandrium_andersonii.AAC.1